MDFHEDLTSLEAASKVRLHITVEFAARKVAIWQRVHLLFLFSSVTLQIQLKSLAEEMQAIVKGLEKVEQELKASESDGPVSEVFCKVSSASHVITLLF